MAAHSLLCFMPHSSQTPPGATPAAEPSLPAQPLRLASRVARVIFATALCSLLLVAAFAIVNGGRLPRSWQGWAASAALLIGVNVVVALWARGSRWLVRERRPAPVLTP